MTRTVPLWDSLSPEEHEFQYNPQRAFPDFARYRQLREPANRQAHELPRQHADLAYGENPRCRLDIFRPDQPHAARTPVHIFFHGGYWRAQDKEAFAFVAAPLAAAGVTAVVANYQLCPAATLDGVVDSALAAVAWVHRNIADYQGDPGQISISGHSAGAHLCAEALACDWTVRGIDPGFLRGAVMISGIYDPAAAIKTTVNEQLRLTPEIAQRHNVEQRPPLVRCPVALFAGGLEPWHWIDQTFRYAHHLHRHDFDPEVHVLPGYNHFDIVQQFLETGSPISAATLRMTR